MPASVALCSPSAPLGNYFMQPDRQRTGLMRPVAKQMHLGEIIQRGSMTLMSSSSKIVQRGDMGFVNCISPASRS